jgi:hypothetical protein
MRRNGQAVSNARVGVLAELGFVHSSSWNGRSGPKALVLDDAANETGGEG